MEIQQLLKKAVESRSSDLHILPGKPPLFRTHGELFPVEGEAVLTPEEIKTAIFSLITPEYQKKFEEELVIDTAVVLHHIGNFRVSIFHQLNGIAAVFRVITEKVPTFEELNLPTVFKRLLTLSSGIVLVTGPTGSGKSTTMAAMVDFINSTRSAHVITIEDPIEYTYEMKRSAINQLQVGRDTPDFTTALRSSLRQDPDVILIGEMRDLETIRLALTAAETGHLVLSTLHASSAPLTINRIVDIFPHEERLRVRHLLSETLQAVICQTLVKKSAGGLIAAFEIMLANTAIRHLIRQDMMTHMESTIQTSGEIGMCTMEQYLQDLVAKKLISTVTARNVLANWGHVNKHE